MSPLGVVASKCLMALWVSAVGGAPVDREQLDALTLEAARAGLKWSPRSTYRELRAAMGGSR